MKKFLASITLAVIASVPLAVATSSPALADGAGGPYATCDYQSSYPGAQFCEGHTWVYSIKQECATMVGTFWYEQNCAPVVPKTYTVRKGDTLWRIAVRAYGGMTHDAHAGQQYRKIMRLNHLRSTKIKVGQKLRLR